MCTRVSHPVGPSTSTPSSAGTPVGKEVQGPVPAMIVAAGTVAGGQTPPVTPATGGLPTPAADQGIQALVATFLTAFGSLRDGIAPHLRSIPAAERTHNKSLSDPRKNAIPLLAHLLRMHPELGVTEQPDSIAQGPANAAALRNAANSVRVLASSLEDTARLAEQESWLGANVVYSTAKVHAHTDRDLAVEPAPVRDALRTGKRTVAAGRQAHAASSKAVAAQQRATRAVQKATAASEAAARAQAAHAARNPTAASGVTPAVNPQGPAPEPASVLQGPAVNPQGPAPGR